MMQDAIRERCRSGLMVLCALLLSGCVSGAQQKDQGKTTFGAQEKEVQQEFAEAMKAAKSQDGHCLECHERLHALCIQWGATEIGVKNDRDWVKVAGQTGSAQTQDQALHALSAMLLEAIAGAPESSPDKHAKEAEQAFAQLLAHHPDDLVARFGHAQALAYLQRELDARAEFQRYLAEAPESDPLRGLALLFAREPDMAAHRVLKDIRITTSSGQVFDTAALKGKVILVDFWMSTCGPCLGSIRSLRAIQDEYGSRRFSMISISIDHDREGWGKTVARQHMNWPQALDEDYSVKSSLGINVVPHLLLIGANGLVLYEGQRLYDTLLLLPSAVKQADIEANQTSTRASNERSSRAMAISTSNGVLP